ncbi:UDP-N-acetylmuramoylalanyl-D-glutamate--2,6-diaminopimelate ligase [hydrothermal vent metagenome]|uniref:UDP-N-acetylmuramoylalanyl-D-glutamate--2,6-diaminopimelate ligase n=1 Tax=hydrothermal vent metagenome TaxID=652676 RepID=A0A3B0VQF0_9ZZZZ
MKVDLSAVLEWLDIITENLAIEVSGLCHDSRKITCGDVFIALSGSDNHGMDFAYQAQRGGACAILAESIQPGNAKPKGRQQPLTIPVIEIDDLSAKLGILATNFYQNPSTKLDIIGITGTNGKTSSAWLMLQAWDKLAIKGAYIGTLGYGTLQQMHNLQNTTPTALHLQRILAGFVEDGITHVSLEVSSHGLSLGRVNATKFKGAGFTNISRDHLDFHETMEKYANAKQQLFTEYNLDFAVINCNDYYGKKWLTTINYNKISYGINSKKADLSASNIELMPKGINFRLNWNKQSYNIFTPLLGKFNIDNIMLVVATLLSQGFEIAHIIDVIPQLKPVPGRMNCVEVRVNSPLIIVDYAHTPDALEQVLMALKEHNARKIWCVFGCGGNRDKGKRPQMGHIAETLADNVVITDDNPRYEDNQQITADILMGMNTKPTVIHSRIDAIAYAINNSHPDDLILIAGKGHESYQLIKGQYFPFDDRLIAKELLENSQEQYA